MWFCVSLRSVLMQLKNGIKNVFLKKKQTLHMCKVINQKEEVKRKESQVEKTKLNYAYNLITYLSQKFCALFVFFKIQTKKKHKIEKIPCTGNFNEKTNDKEIAHAKAKAVNIENIWPVVVRCQNHSRMITQFPFICCYKIHFFFLLSFCSAIS